MSITAVPIRPVKRAWIAWLTAAMAAAAIGGLGLAWAGTAKPVAMKGDNESYLAWHKKRSGIVTTASGLQYQVVKKGAGRTPGDTDIALINYRGTLRDGKVFDQAQRAPLPVGGVVPGFAEAMKLMPRGATYRVWIPAALGYGAASPGEAIPANSLLVFDIDMIDFRSQAEIQALQAQLQAQQMRGQMPGAGVPGGAVPGGQPLPQPVPQSMPQEPPR